MVNKSLILAFTAVAAAAPQLGGLGGLSGLKPGSKATGSEKAARSGETMPDGLNYNKPLEDDDDDKDWSNWEYNEEDYYEDPKDPGTLGSTVENEDPDTYTTTVALQITSSAPAPYEEFPSTTAHRNISTTSTVHRDVTTSTTLRLFKSTSIPVSKETAYTTLRQLKSTPALGYKDVPSTTARNEIPAYSTPVKQNDELETYETPKQNNEIAEPYHSTTTLKNEVAELYHTTTAQANVQEPYHTTTTLKNEVAPEPYHTTPTLKNEIAPEPYHTTTAQANVQEPYHTTPTLKNEIAPEPYHTTTTQANVQEPYHTTIAQANVQEPYQSTPAQADVQEAYRRNVQEGYGKAEFEKQPHVPSTTAAGACAAKHSDVVLPAVSSIPAFGQVAENHLSQVSGSSLAPAKLSMSSVWSAVPYSTPAVKPAETTMTTSSLPLLAATTTLQDTAVPSDAKILVNNLRPNNATTESAHDAKIPLASPAESTVKLEKLTATTASIATAPASVLLQPYYPTMTGAANATAGIAAATTGARSNNTLPEFEGAAASSSSFIAGSVIALAIAAFAL